MHSEQFEESCLLEHSGELPPQALRELEEHRRSCQRCQDITEALWVGSRMAGRAALSLPEAALERITAEALSRPPAAAEDEALKRGPAFSLRFPRALLAAGTIAASLLVALHVSRQEQRPKPELAWTNGLEESLEGLDGELDEIAQQLADSNYEIDLELRGLEQTTETVTEQLR